MAKTKISEFSSTPGNNTDIDSINIAEGCAPSGINDAIRELMAQLKDFQAGTAGDSFNGPVGTTTAAAGAFTTLSASGAVTLSGGTANGVPYLNGSKVLTTGSALTFDGTRLTSTTGKFGSGAASNSASLMVNNATNTATGIQLFQDGIESWIMGMPANSAGLAWSASGSEQMRLTSTGLGIGTSSPGAKLDVRGNATFTGNGTSRQTADFTNTGGQLYVGAESSSGGAVFVGSSAYAGIVGTNTNTPLQLGTNGTIKATLDSSGNLGLGVTPSAWGSGYKAFEFGSGGSSLFGGTSAAAQTYLTANAYFNGTSWIYKNTAIASYYEQSGGKHTWYTAPSGTAGNAISFTQAMTLDASGRLLVGTTTAQGQLTISNLSGSIGLTAYTSGGSVAEHTYSNTPGVQIDSYQSVFGSPYTKTTDIVANADSGAASQLRLFTTSAGSAPAERARIDSSGNLLVGTTSADPISAQVNGLSIRGAVGDILASAGNTPALQLARRGSDGGVIQFYKNTTAVGSVSTTSVLTTYNTTSDYRLKTVIGAVSGAGQRIDALEPVEYEWKSEGSRTRGFLAHKFQEVYPQSVSGEKDAVDADGKPVYQNMQAGTSEVIADLVAEIQSLRKRLAAAGIA